MRSLSWIAAALMIVLVVTGRVDTMHLTEGEALIEGWMYWVGALLCACLVVVLERDRG